MAGLFDFQDPRQIRSDYMNSQMVSPAQMGNQDLYSKLASTMANAGTMIGTGIGGMMGGVLPQEAEQRRVQEVMKGVNLTSPESITNAANMFAKMGDNARAQALFEQADLVNQRNMAQEDRAAKQAAAEQAKASKASLVQELVKRDPNLTPAIAEVLAGDKEALIAIFNPKIKTEVVKTAAGVKLINSETGAVIKNLGAAETDTSGLKGLAAQLKAQQLADLQDKAAERESTSASEQKQDISRLARNESDAEIAISTGLRALGLAPSSAGGAFTQAVFDSIPWTDAKSLSNLVESLNNEKAISTLQQLKEQSRTGATGFGALSEKELNLILAKTRKLDPTDKMFKENLKIVLDGWEKIRQESRNSRLEIQGVEDPLGLR